MTKPKTDLDFKIDFKLPENFETEVSKAAKKLAEKIDEAIQQDMVSAFTKASVEASKAAKQMSKAFEAIDIASVAASVGPIGFVYGSIESPVWPQASEASRLSVVPCPRCGSLNAANLSKVKRYRCQQESCGYVSDEETLNLLLLDGGRIHEYRVCERCEALRRSYEVAKIEIARSTRYRCIACVDAGPKQVEPDPVEPPRVMGRRRIKVSDAGE